MPQPAAVYATTRSADAARRLRRNALMAAVGLGVIGWAWVTTDLSYWAISFFILLTLFQALILALTVAGLIVSRQPLIVTDQDVVIRTALTARVPRAHITAIAPHADGKGMALTYDDPAKGHQGQIKLPWNFIAEPQDQVVADLSRILKIPRQSAAA
jgi:hypothetical protein